MEEAISEAIFDTVSQLGYTAVKPEQFQVIAGVLNCSDVAVHAAMCMQYVRTHTCGQRNCVMLRHSTFHGTTTLVLVSPDPSAGSRVWLRETNIRLHANIPNECCG